MTAPYSRVYPSIRDDDKFAHVYECDICLSWWVRLLLDADALWPASVYFPAGCPQHAIDELAKSTLLTRVNGSRYKITGLDAERAKRQGQASNAATVRWDRAKAIAPETGDPADAYWQLTGRYPAGKALKWIDDLGAQYGATQTVAAIVKAHIDDSNVGTLLGRSSDALRSEARALDRKEADEERVRLAEKRSIPVTMPEWDEATRTALWESHKIAIAKAVGK